MTDWSLVEAARARAAEKHGAMSMEHLPVDHKDWPIILMEEVGEVAHALTYDGRDDSEIWLRHELLDVLAVASAWLDAADRVIAEKMNPGGGDG